MATLKLFRAAIVNSKDEICAPKKQMFEPKRN